MSAIGDYVYFTYLWYTKGDPRRERKSRDPNRPNQWDNTMLQGTIPDRNFITLGQARSAIKNVHQKIRKAFVGRGDEKFAKDYQIYLNAVVGAQSGYYNKDTATELEQQYVENFKKKLEESINKELGPLLDYSTMTLNRAEQSNAGSGTTLLPLLQSVDEEGLPTNTKLTPNDPYYKAAKRLKTTNDQFAFNRKVFIDLLEKIQKLLSANANKAIVVNAMTGKDTKANQSIVEDRIRDLKTTIQLLNNLAKPEKVKNIIQESAQYYNEKYNMKGHGQRALNAYNKLIALFGNKDENGKVTINQNATITGFHNKQTGQHGLLHDVKTLINYIALPSAALIGKATEGGTAAAAWMLNEQAETEAVKVLKKDLKLNGRKVIFKEGNVSAKVIGDVKTASAIKKSDVLLTEKELKDWKVNFTSKVINGEEYWVEANPKQNKVDVTIKFETVDDKGNVENQNVNMSVKHTSSDIIRFMQDGSFWNLISNENENDFINHYMNIMQPKQNYNNVDWQSFGKENADKITNAEKLVTAQRNSIETAMNVLMIAKAIAGYNITKVTKDSSGALSLKSMTMADYLTVYDAKQGDWSIYTMNQIYNQFLAVDERGYRDTGIIITAGDGGHRTSNPFPNQPDAFEPTEPNISVSEMNAVIRRRIVRSLHYMRKRKLDVYIRNVTLRRMRQQ